MRRTAKEDTEGGPPPRWPFSVGSSFEKGATGECYENGQSIFECAVFLFIFLFMVLDPTDSRATTSCGSQRNAWIPCMIHPRRRLSAFGDLSLKRTCCCYAHVAHNARIRQSSVSASSRDSLHRRTELCRRLHREEGMEGVSGCVRDGGSDERREEWREGGKNRGR